MAISEKLIKLLEQSAEMVFYIALDTEHNRATSNYLVNQSHLFGSIDLIFEMKQEPGVYMNGNFNVTYQSGLTNNHHVQRSMAVNSDEILITLNHTTGHISEHIDVTNKENFYKLSSKPAISRQLPCHVLLNMSIPASVIITKSIPAYVCSQLSSATFTAPTNLKTRTRKKI
ncbi:hypothetical protein ABN214_15380 [Proteus terrae]|uniref:hypothetical protein n=1 Tax=Proteus terrae TaxID=1574161 RepID=UPI0032DB934B